MNCKMKRSKIRGVCLGKPDHLLIALRIVIPNLRWNAEMAKTYPSSLLCQRWVTET